MRHYSHIARDRMKQLTSQMPMEFDCSSALDEEAQRELHAAIGGGSLSGRLSEYSRSLNISDSEN